MSQTEFKKWRAFFAMYPFDDLHRYHRPAALVAASMSGKYQEKQDFLSPEPIPPGMTQADVNTMRAFGQKPAALLKD